MRITGNKTGLTLCVLLKMKFIIIILCINFWPVVCTFLWQENSKDNDKIILTEIISNYLYKYFNNKVFLSIVSSSVSHNQAQFHEDLSSILLVHSRLSVFSYTILGQIDRIQRENVTAFNVILIDMSASLK